jgi:hypothetical protein
MNELKLHAEDQDTIIAALTGITLPERAALYQDIAVPVERSHRNDGL